MRVEIINEPEILRFNFLLEDGDLVAPSRNFSMGNDSVCFRLPADLGESIHPDLISLAIILSCHPFVGKELHLPIPVSRRFMDGARRVISRYRVIAETSEGLAPREAPIKTRAGLAYSGGVDSTAALAVMPSTTVPIFMNRPVRDGSLYNPDAAIKSCEILAQLGYDVQVIGSDVEYLREPVGFPTDLAHATPAVLLADFLGLDSLAFGTVLESAYGVGHEIFRDYPQMSHWRFYGTLFSAAGLPMSLPVAGISEVGTSMIVETAPVGFVAQSCIRGAWQSPCWNCWKCFRKGLLGMALGKYDSNNLDLGVMLASNEVKKKLGEIPISHENVVSYSLGGVDPSIHPFLEVLNSRVYSDFPLEMLEKWFSPSLELVHEKWEKGIRNNILRFLEPMSSDEEVAIRNWSMTEFIEDENIQFKRERVIKSL